MNHEHYRLTAAERRAYLNGSWYGLKLVSQLEEHGWGELHVNGFDEPVEVVPYPGAKLMFRDEHAPELEAAPREQDGARPSRADDE